MFPIAGLTCVSNMRSTSCQRRWVCSAVADKVLIKKVADGLRSCGGLALLFAFAPYFGGQVDPARRRCC